MTSLQPILSIAAMVCAALAIAGEYIKPRCPWMVYIFKPLTTVLILAVALLPGTFMTSGYARAIAIGLVFSLMGDIWLMLPRDRFVYGLASFLAAHISYIVAFREGMTARGLMWIVLILTLIGVMILRYLWQGLPKGLRPAVIVYVAAILMMAALAVSRALPAVGLSPGPLWAGIGALLFVASDATLAINRFRKPFHLAQAVVLGTYFAAQLLIALSVFGQTSSQ